jgi:two-component system chemotaxis response regulator CheB
VQALGALLASLPKDLRMPLVIVQHIGSSEDNGLVKIFQHKSPLVVKEAEDKEIIRSGTVYFAPPDYHLLIEMKRIFSLSFDKKVNYSRPSIDVLFESAASAYRAHLAAVVLTGANSDGAEGIRTVKKNGGITIAQDPLTAAFSAMPQAAVDTGAIDLILSLKEIGEFIQKENYNNA